MCVGGGGLTPPSSFPRPGTTHLSLPDVLRTVLCVHPFVLHPRLPRWVFLVSPLPSPCLPPPSPRPQADVLPHGTARNYILAASGTASSMTFTLTLTSGDADIYINAVQGNTPVFPNRQGSLWSGHADFMTPKRIVVPSTDPHALTVYVWARGVRRGEGGGAPWRLGRCHTTRRCQLYSLEGRLLVLLLPVPTAPACTASPSCRAPL